MGSFMMENLLFNICKHPNNNDAAAKSPRIIFIMFHLFLEKNNMHLNIGLLRRASPNLTPWEICMRSFLTIDLNY